MSASVRPAPDSLTGALLRLLERPITPADRQRAAWHLLDWIGCAFLGRSAPAGRALAQWADAGAVGPCTAWGAAGPREASVAALVNGGLGSLFELDDVHRLSILHPGDTVVPAALAAAQREGATGADLLEALIHGYEVAIRIGSAAGPTHYRHWYSTATCGVFGAAAACARVLGLGSQAHLDALGQAGMLSAGLWQCRQEPTFSKQLATARSAQSGLLAADLARIGFPGPRQILEGPHGFFAAACPQPDEQVLLAPGPWKLHEVSFKPWAACRHVHPAIEAALALRQQGLQAEQIQTLTVYTYADALAFADCPQPGTDHEARFSLQHAVAVACCRGQIRLDDCGADRRAEPAVAQLRARVRLQEEPGLSQAYPARFGARLVARTLDGRHHEAEVLSAKGDPENPLNDQELQAKALASMRQAGLSDPDAQRVIERTLALAHGGSLPALTQALSVA